MTRRLPLTVNRPAAIDLPFKGAMRFACMARRPSRKHAVGRMNESARVAGIGITGGSARRPEPSISDKSPSPTVAVTRFG